MGDERQRVIDILGHGLPNPIGEIERARPTCCSPRASSRTPRSNHRGQSWLT